MERIYSVLKFKQTITLTAYSFLVGAVTIFGSRISAV
jgi:hypothetical protein